MTVTAEYEINNDTVSFNTNGGSSVHSKSIAYLGSVTQPADPEKTGFPFDRWYTNSALTTTYDFARKVEGDLSLEMVERGKRCLECSPPARRRKRIG